MGFSVAAHLVGQLGLSSAMSTEYQNNNGLHMTEAYLSVMHKSGGGQSRAVLPYKGLRDPGSLMLPLFLPRGRILPSQSKVVVEVPATTFSFSLAE